MSIINFQLSISLSSSAFIVPNDFSAEWQDITLVHQRTHTLIYTASRYGRRFLLKALPPEDEQLTDFRLQQEQEFRLGIQLVHPNIAATYSLEHIDGVGRCIVQEWIDGITLGEWLQSKPSKTNRERVFTQLLDALEYIHGLQLVHHDLKADNILITRNGTNVKLIDFGLSALDSTLSPISNDPRKDLQSLGKIMRELLPSYRYISLRTISGSYPNIAALRKAIQRRRRIIRLLPVVLSAVLLIIAAIIFYLSWHEHHAEQQRYEAMTQLVNTHIEQERAEYMDVISHYDSLNGKNTDEMVAYMEKLDKIATLRQRQWAIRDSIMATYDASDPLREQFFQLWTHRELELDDELFPKLRNQ